MRRTTRRTTSAKSLPPFPKAPTGIRGLDGITGGGLPRGRPTLVRGDQIPAIPTLVRRLPAREIIGDRANTERVLVGLDLLPHQ